MRLPYKTVVIHLQLLLILGGVCMLIGACSGIPDQKNWITIGQTTREEVIKRYGEPDFVIASAEGETAIYRPRDSGISPPPVQIPTIQAGPLGTATTKLETHDPGINTNPTIGNLPDRPAQELHIHYNTKGIVQQLSR
jgi:hypothetical protein